MNQSLHVNKTNFHILYTRPHFETEVNGNLDSNPIFSSNGILSHLLGSKFLGFIPTLIFGGAIFWSQSDTSSLTPTNSTRVQCYQSLFPTSAWLTTEFCSYFQHCVIRIKLFSSCSSAGLHQAHQQLLQQTAIRPEGHVVFQIPW